MLAFIFVFRYTPNNIMIKRAYWISSNSSFIKYYDSNIELFSIAPPLVVALTRS